MERIGAVLGLKRRPEQLSIPLVQSSHFPTGALSPLYAHLKTNHFLLLRQVTSPDVQSEFYPGFNN